MLNMLTRLSVHLGGLRSSNTVLVARCLSANVATINRPATTNIDDVKSDVSALSNEEISQDQQELCRRKNLAFALPNKLQHLIKDILIPDQRNLGALMKGARILHNQLWSRHLPVSNKELTTISRETTNRLLKDTGIESLGRDEKKALLPKVKDAVLKSMRRHVYRWRPMEYDEFGSHCYLLARTPMEYAILRNVFKEIRFLDPKIEPQSCLDFGSGVGSVWWTLKEQFPNSFNEYFSVEPSKAMRELARFLAKGGPSGKELPSNEYSQRAQLPATCSITYDIVVSAFSLLELPNERERRDVLRILWAKTKRHLVIIENGTLAGFTVVKEARNYILQLSEIDDNSDGGRYFKGHVLAPCTHNLPCQRLHGELTPNPCSFRARSMDLLEPHHRSHSSLYSYVVMTKVKPETLFEGPPCARIINEVLVRRRHVVCRICTSKGEVQEKIFTKGKHSKELYKAAKCSKWGDLFLFESVPSASKKQNAAAILTNNDDLELTDGQHHNDMEKEDQEVNTGDADDSPATESTVEKKQR